MPIGETTSLCRAEVVTCPYCTCKPFTLLTSSQALLHGDRNIFLFLFIQLTRLRLSYSHVQEISMRPKSLELKTFGFTGHYPQSPIYRVMCQLCHRLIQSVTDSQLENIRSGINSLTEMEMERLVHFKLPSKRVCSIFYKPYAK